VIGGEPVADLVVMESEDLIVHIMMESDDLDTAQAGEISLPHS